MHIVEFLEHIRNNTLPDNNIWCIVSSVPSNSIIEMVRNHINAFHAVGCSHIDLHEADDSTVARELGMSFLGQKYVYIAQGMYALDKRTQKRMLSHIFTPSIAHHVVFFTDQNALVKQYIDAASIGMCVSCDTIDKDMFVRMYHALFAQDFPRQLLAYVFQQHNQLRFEHAYLVMWYYYLLGKNFISWCQSWLPRVVAPKQSLFQLSEYFFQKNATRLWFSWYAFSSVYPHEFWVAFWSEHLWQAYVFITIAQEHTVARARSHVNKLPFAFMQRDWRSVSLNEITQAMTYIYTLDLYVKSGGNPYAIEQFLHYWLSGSFTKKTIWCNDPARDDNRHRLLSR